MNLVSFFSEHGDNDLFFLARNERKPRLRDIVIEAMRLLARGPLTKLELQKLVKIRRKTFIRLLAGLVQAGVVIRTGTGKRRDPFRYMLADHYRG
ncbi:MAG: hypothetical protein BroJett040_10220 [Oligoflexia bacterium]|nr:MAG: hypothetical protein BroJett040_10220 [Oligoflexia bacterium]